MIYWAQLLHFYQPPTQLPHILKKVCQESYRPLIEVFRQHPHARATVNIAGVLTEMLDASGYRDILEGLKELAEKGQIEFTGTGKYHPFLPLLPPQEMERQIRLNYETNREYVGRVYQPRGFFPPEMGYSPEITLPIIREGYEWTVLSGVACPRPWPLREIYFVEKKGRRLAVFFRDDILSNKISFKKVNPGEFLNNLLQLKGNSENIYVITAMDAETYGHHIENWDKLFLARVYDELSPAQQLTLPALPLAEQERGFLESGEFHRQVEMVTVSRLLSLFPQKGEIEPRASSWSSTVEELEDNNPFPLWLGKGNEVHRLQWEHLDLCYEIVGQAQALADSRESQSYANIARVLLDRAHYSCQFWWASRRPMWDVNLVLTGLMEQEKALFNAYKALEMSGASLQEKRRGYYLVVASREVRRKIEDLLFKL